MYQPALLHGKELSNNLQVQPAFSGFTLIELMIVLAVIAIILTLAIPTYSDYSARSKIAESLSVAAGAKTAVASTCQENPTITNLTNNLAGFSFQETEYVASIVIDGACLAPRITMTTQVTGIQPDPVLTLTGDFTLAGRITWICVSDGLNAHVPNTCRS